MKTTPIACNTVLKKGTINLGKIACYGTRKINRAAFTYELRQGEHGPEFSACAEVWNGPQTDCVMRGQCLDEVAKMARQSGVALPVKAKRCLAIHKDWHLNGMKAGTVEQEVEIARHTFPGHQASYSDWACKLLKKAGLYEVPITPDMHATGGFPEGATTYAYGTRWLHSPLPQAIIDEVMAW